MSACQGPAPACVPIKDYYTVEEVAHMLHVHVTRVRALAVRSDDPMPFRRFPGQLRGAFINRDDLIAWIDAHTVLVGEEAAARGHGR